MWGLYANKQPQQELLWKHAYNIAWFLLLKSGFNLMNSLPTVKFPEYEENRWQRTRRKSHLSSAIGILSKICQFLFFLFFFPETRIRDHCWLCLIWINTEPPNKILLKGWFNVQRKWTHSNISLYQNFSLIPLKIDKHVYFCMKSHIKTTGLFAKSVFW